MVRELPETQKGQTILVRGARQLLTLRGAGDAPRAAGAARRSVALGDLGLIADGAVLIRDGRILQAGPSRRVENLAEARRAREIDAAGRLVMPAFIDCNADLVLPHAPLAIPNARLAGSGEEFRRAAHEIHMMPARRMELRARMVAEGIARHGTTTVGTSSGNGGDRSEELKLLRVLGRLNGKPLLVVPTYYGARFPPLASHENRCEYLNWIYAEVLPAIARRKLAACVAVNGETGGFPADLVQLYLERARHLGFMAVVHAGDNAAAVRLGIRMEAAWVALSSVAEEDAAALAGSRTMAVLTPASTMHRRGEARGVARALVDAGAAVALASGFGSGGSPTYNMQMVISLACSEMSMTPAEAITAATVNGAYALGVGDQTGTLGPGKRADLVLLNVQDYREIAYHFGINHVHMVLQGGVMSYQEGGLAY